ncbi:histidine phosphatase family protein [Arthrobacter sp.]|uniref:histidine phosphatase family protein n=1 Tax=Arthrobacter sp. TaxID=1667 RepID=UPI0026DF466F|nr:histidine phosphatase family protein [Arthrobacter sp.]MDO5752013.1 histidine phosphatase family protein [Arthrobacter sp.]
MTINQSATRKEPRTVYLVRHGQTGLNRTGYIRGHANPPLDTHGEDQAHEVGRVLARVRPVKIASSPLARAVQTAGAVAEAAHLVTSVDQRLIDRDFGQWTGFLEAKVAALWGTAASAPGVETDDSIVQRAMPALEDAADAAEAGPVVLVTHDAVIRALLVSLSPAAAGIELPTGCLSVLTRSGGEWTVVSIGQSAAAALEDEGGTGDDRGQ